MDQNERDSKINAWAESVKALKSLKAREAQLRAELVAHCFETPPAEGVQNFELGSGYKLKACFKQSYSLTDKIEDVLVELENQGIEGEFVAGRLVRWKPELSVSEYKSLKPQHLEIMQKAIVVKPALPSLELVEPK